MMLLACDIGNTNISIGVFTDDDIVFHSKIATVYDKSADEYAILLKGILSMYGMAAADIDGAVLSSVVRPLNDKIIAAVVKLTRITPLMVGPGVKTGLNIKTDIPSQIGADIVANAVAAAAIADFPIIVVALGTATTLTGINSDGELCGVLICPGVSSSLKALSAHAAELPQVALEKPKGLFGKNTIDAMVSGIVFGNASMIEGLLDRFSAEWDELSLTVVVTGGHADSILPYINSDHKIMHEPNLTLFGLKKIYQLSRRHKK